MANHDPPEHSPEKITVYEGLEAVRKRHEMYVGPTSALTDFVFDAMCLALTEAHCGTCSEISVRVDGTKFSVLDNGLGLSLEVGRFGRPFAEAAMTVLHACRDHKEHERLKHEFCGIGLAVVNALSKSASVMSSNGERSFKQTYIVGTPQGEFEQLPEPLPGGTVLAFEIDEAYLHDPRFDAARLRSRIEEADADFSRVQITIGQGGEG